MNKFKIPLYKPEITKEEILNVNECLKSSWISSKGKYLNEFERLFSEYTKIKHSTAVVNGTAALHLALLGLNIKENDEVIVPTFTYVASVNAIRYVNAKPVFVDSSLDGWQLDLDEVEKKISSKTKAIICPHIYGQMTNMNKLNKLKKKYNLFLIEDCAESLGSFFQSKHSGNFSDVATFSFYGSKTITTGEGGMVCSNNMKIINKITKLKLQGIASGNRSYWHDVIGYNYKMTNICAAIGVAQLKRIELILKKKRNLYFKYLKELKDAPIKLQNENKDTVNSFWLVGGITKNKTIRNSLMTFLNKCSVETRPGFYPIHTMPMYKKLNKSKFPVASKLGSNIICLPSSPDLSNKDIEYICNKIKKFFKNKS